MRVFLRRFLHPVHATAAVGIAGSLAIVPMMTGGLMQFSAGLITMPDTVSASVSGPESVRLFRPHDAGTGQTLARDLLGDRLDRAYDLAMIDDTPPAPRFEELDKRRLPVVIPVPAARPLTDVEHYAMITEAAAAVSPGGLDLRFAAAASPVALAAVAMPVTREMVEAEAEATAETEAAIVLARAVPVPNARPAHAPAGATAHSTLAYANPNAEAGGSEASEGVFGRLFGRSGSQLPDPGQRVAVYDIGSATVYMPNGEKLEAHSGLAHMQDNPRYVKEKNRGPTPPNLYKLRMREARFHGVEAIRLLPADGKKKFNRDGLLAHTYMYVGGGDRSQSNGCVVFKDYDRFLKAFKRGEVKHMIVVPHLDEVPTYLAAL